MVILMLATLASPRTARADSHPEWSLSTSDQLLHFTASALMTVGGTALFKKQGQSKGSAILTASLLTLALGVAKERLIDSQWTPADMKANLLGIGAGAVASIVIPF